MRKWFYCWMRDNSFYKWLNTKNEKYLDDYYKWADKARPLLSK